MLAHAQTTNDPDAITAAYTLLSRAAFGLGANQDALEYARQKRIFEASRQSPDPAGIFMADVALAAAILQADGITTEFTALLPRIYADQSQTAEAEELRAALLEAMANRLDTDPDGFLTTEVYAHTPPQQRADLLVLLAEAADREQDLAAAIEWLEIGYAHTAELDQAYPRLKDIEGRVALALDDAGHAVTAFRTVTDRWLASPERQTAGAPAHLPYHIAAAAQLSEGQSQFQNEAFILAQLAGSTRAGAALRSVFLRNQADGEVQNKLRARRKVEEDLSRLEAAISQARFDGRSANDLRAQRDLLRVEHKALMDEIAIAAPALAQATDPILMRLDQVKAVLRADEVLVLYATSDLAFADSASASHLIAVTRENVRVAAIPTRAELVTLADQLRCAAALTDPNCGTAGGAGTRGKFSLSSAGTPTGPSFDTSVAHAAYQTFLAPVADMLEGKSRLVVVPDAALATLPVHLMIKRPLATGRPLSEAHWLIRDHSVAIAPTVASFVSQRSASPKRRDRPAFLGVGDPLIGVQQSGPIDYACAPQSGSVKVAALAPDALRGAVGSVRNSLIVDLAALPDTRCELARIAERFETSSLLLHADATESRIKDMNDAGELRRFSVLNFATHGLIAGEIGVNDSGLVLSPPKVATARDDGLLTTAEIADLRLDADFVILSACNTAAGDSRADEGLAGLASAFFIAGAKSLLVSHWPVYSDAAVELTTGTFDALAESPQITRAEALRLAMLSIIDDPAASPRQLHPSYWGPFMLVGDEPVSGQ